MKPDTKAVRRILAAWLVFFAAATLALGVVSLQRARAAAVRGSAELPVLGRMPSFSMSDQRRRLLTDESLRGQVLVIDFFYANCATSCPILTAKMRAVQGALAAREREFGKSLAVHLVSVTLDPQNDTPEVLLAYAQSAGADEARWSFLSGRSADLDRVVAQGFKVSYVRADPNAGIAAIMHGEWLVLVDPAGAIRGYYAASDPERMQALVTDAVRLADGVRRTYHATGVIQSFGPQRAFVNIAHDDVPGYMMAMTMSFEPERPDMLAGLAPHARVAFDFFETDDARRVLTRIVAQP